MKNIVLEEIKMSAVKRLKEEYGFCGLADGETQVMLNSTDKQGKDIIIVIKSGE